jgi:outer membrane receptor protein involved in Fe transport
MMQISTWDCSFFKKLKNRIRPWRAFMKRLGLAIGTIFILVLAAGTTVHAAETTASIIGTIYDDNNVPLPGATITAVNSATNFTRVISSEASGFYRIPLLPPGTYTLTVEVQGFAKEVRRDIVLTVGKEIALDITLKLAAAGETMEIEAETPLIDATKSQLGSTVDQAAIKNLPLNGRDYTQLSLLAPGVRQVNITQYGQFSIGGQRGDSVNYTIDGGENNFSYTNESRSGFTQEGVQEFQILTNRFSAEYGRSTSGVINVISKSGTNELHGNGFFFYRGDDLDAQDVFSKALGVKAPFDQEQGGGTIGGPIVKDRTFFFAAYEGTNTDKTLSVAVTPETPEGIRPQPIDRDLVTAKVNHQFNTNNSMVFRYNFDKRGLAGFYAGGRYVDTVQQDVTANSFAVSETAVLSSNTYNEILVQYGRFLRTDTPENTSKPWEFRPSSVTGHYYCCPQRFLENRIEILDTFTHVFAGKGDHTLKTGIDYIHVGSELTFAQYIGGAYFFGTDEPLDINNPSTFPTFFELGVGNPTTEPSNNQFSAFVQDDWRVNDRLTLNLGLRYDIETFGGVTDNPVPLIPIPLEGEVIVGKIPPVDKNNFAPRLGFTYDWGGKGTTIIRGGYGRYFKPILHNVYNNALLFDQNRYLILSIDDPNLLAQFFPAIPPESVLAATPGDIRPMLAADLAFTDQVSIGFQHQISNDFVINADYVYMKGNDLTREHNLNAPQDLVNPGDPPYPQYGRLRLLTTDGESWYSALQLSVQKRYSNNLMFTASYTLSKAEDNATDFYSIAEPNNQFDLDAEKGPQAFDQRHLFSFSAIYDLPWELQLGSIIRASSGTPFNWLLNEDHNSDGFFNDRPDFDPNGGVFPFANPPADRPGNLERNFGRGTNFFQVDLRVAKGFNISRTRLDLILEFFNIFNRTNYNFRQATVNKFIDFSLPNPFADPTLGQATEVFDPRQIQLGVKFSF